MKFHHLIKNLTYVKVDQRAARHHWKEMVNFAGTSLYEHNRNLIVSQKAVAGILSHRKTLGFRMHCAKEKFLLRRIHHAQHDWRLTA